jgi:molybdenum cofactor synthesis domain-containing protein
MSEANEIKACLLVIGNEVLSGRTRDANIQYLGENLGAIGIRLAEVRVIPDVTDVIAGTLNEVRGKFDYVFTTGGIGPTHDDITSAAIAQAFGVPLIRDPGALALLRGHYKPGDLNESRLKMADVPQGAELIENPVSAAPGYRIENVIVFAGVPRIMQAMFEGYRDRLRGGRPVVSVTLSAYATEGVFAGRLAEIQAAHADVEIGSYPFVRGGKLGVSVVCRSEDKTRAEAAAAAVRAALQEMGVEVAE